MTDPGPFQAVGVGATTNPGPFQPLGIPALEVDVSDGSTVGDAAVAVLSGNLDVWGTATANVVPAAQVTIADDETPVAAGLEVVWDFDSDGNFDEPEESLTTEIMSLSSSIGRDFASQIRGKITPGVLQFEMANWGDLFHPFNTDSPLNQPPFSLESGPRIMLREIGAGDPAPARLVQDRFDGAGGLGDADTGQTWAQLAGGEPPYRVAGKLTIDDALVVVDAGAEDYYVQADGLGPMDLTNTVAVLYRLADASNYGIVELSDGQVQHRHVVAGVPSTESTTLIEDREGITVGVHCFGAVAVVYVDGVPVATDDAAGTDEQLVGISGHRDGQRSVKVDEFHAWVGVRARDVAGVLWTGYVDQVLPSSSSDKRKTVTVVAYGRWARLSKADVQAPRSAGEFSTPFMSSVGTYVGPMIGAVLHSARLLDPPAPGIQRGVDKLGAIGLDDAKAITHLNKLNETEGGLVWETEAGSIRHLDGGNASGGGGTLGSVVAAPVSSWGDSPAAAQFQFTNIELLDLSRELVNQVRPVVSSTAPYLQSVQANAASSGPSIQNTVRLATDPAAAAGDLHIWVVVSTVYTLDEQWLNPPGWESLRNVGADGFRVRAYATKLTAEAIGTEEIVYADEGVGGGAWNSHRFLVKNWSGDVGSISFRANGVGAPNLLDPARGGQNNPPPVLWTPRPSLFITGRSGALASTGAGEVDVGAGLEAVPNGYTLGSRFYTAGVGTPTFDVALDYAARIGVAAVEDPTPFLAIWRNFDYVDAYTIAIPGPDPATVQVDDVASQERREAILTYPDPGVLFPDAAGAQDYGVSRLYRHGLVRPLLRVEFSANKSAAYKAQANGVRVQDKIHCVFDSNQGGTSGLTYEGDFIVENVTRDVRDGGKVHMVTWELSPSDPGFAAQVIRVT